MPARISPSDDPVRPGPSAPLTIEVDGITVSGLIGQTIAGVLLAAGRPTWRTSRRGRPRGVFCGIGICHDCLLTVNGLPDVRACQRRAAPGDIITTADAAETPASAAPLASAATSATDATNPAGAAHPPSSAATGPQAEPTSSASATDKASPAKPASATGPASTTDPSGTAEPASTTDPGGAAGGGR